MYAIIKTGGKQYRVAKDGIVDVELLGVEQGAQVEFDKVLFFSDGSHIKVDAHDLEGYIVTGKVLETIPGPKIDTIKYKPSRNIYRRFGHRQHYSRVQIEFIGPKKEKAKKGAK